MLLPSRTASSRTSSPLASHSRLSSRIIRSKHSLLWLLHKRKRTHRVLFLLFTHSLLRGALVVNERGSNPTDKKKKPTRLGWFSFWLRGWDLNLTTSGLWARRATELLYPAIYNCFLVWCRWPGLNRYDTHVSRDFKSRASANSATPAEYQALCADDFYIIAQVI